MWKIVVMLGVVMAGMLSAGYANEIEVMVDNVSLQFPDQKPIIQEGRTLVPLRSVFEAIGATVDWNADTRCVTAKKRFDVVNLTIDDKDLYKNGTKITEMDVPAQIINGRTMVPARYVAEAFDGKVTWDGTLNLVNVATEQYAHRIKDIHKVESMKTATGKTAVDIKYSYPVIENSEQNSVVDVINEKLKSYAENWVVGVKQELEDYSLVALAEETEEKYEYELAFDITADEEGLLSVVYRCVANSGGAHPNSWKDAMVISFETGEELNLVDIFNMDEDYIMMSIEKFYEIDIDENPEKFYENALEILPEAMKNVEYYVTEDRVIFFFNPYEIAPYAAGYVEIVVERN